jgi:hypothetical protein
VSYLTGRVSGGMSAVETIVVGAAAFELATTVVVRS